MATYTLTPSSWGGTATITDPSNAYTDTTSATYASVASNVYSKAYLGGFDFSTIPQGSTITSLTVKVKAQSSYSGDTGYSVRLYSDVDGNTLSGTQNLSQTAEVYTLSLTESVETIIGYSSTLCIRFNGSNTNRPMSAYGAEIIVTATPAPRNKVLYGNETLIDLTSDTATASDVASGKTFHLASGAQATGTASGGVTQGIISPQTSVSSSSLSFAGLQGEPISFVVYMNAPVSTWVNVSGTAYKTMFIRYDGTNRYTIAAYGGGDSMLRINDRDISFTYTNGTLTFSSGTGGGFLNASSIQYTLVYLY